MLVFMAIVFIVLVFSVGLNVYLLRHQALKVSDAVDSAETDVKVEAEKAVEEVKDKIK